MSEATEALDRDIDGALHTIRRQHHLRLALAVAALVLAIAFAIAFAAAMYGDTFVGAPTVLAGLIPLLVG